MSNASNPVSPPFTTHPPCPAAPPARQIRAHIPSPTTIVVYQAYPSAIASAAVEHQNLAASPAFLFTRMTWIKPSWNWMMYRCGYSYKDAGQERVLAMTMRREGLEELLRSARLTHKVGEGRDGVESEGEKTDGTVRVQWDPERGVRGERLGWRSIQIGIPKGLSRRWVEEWIVGIEDVTDRARRVKDVLDRDESVGQLELAEMGLLLGEEVVEVEEGVRMSLGMD